MVFALHPIQAESVAWITERKNLLSGLFSLSASWAYLHWALPATASPADTESHSRNVPSWLLYQAALGLYLCALLSKTVAATLPLALLLAVWWKRGRLLRRDLLPLIPLLALGVPFGMLTLWLEKYHVGARGPAWDLTLVERLLVAGRALWFYVGKLYLPLRLTFVYPRWHIDAAAWWQYLYPLAAALVVLFLARKRRMTGPLTAVLFFIVTLSPALGFLDVYPMQYSFVADHFQYLAGIGPIALAVAAGRRSAGWLGTRGERAARGVAAVALSGLLVLTWRQCQIYENRESLWRDTLAKNPACPMAHVNLGNVFQERGDVGQALVHYREALTLAPHDALARNNLGNILHGMGRTGEAIAEYEAVLRRDPRDALAHYNLASVLHDLERYDEAAVHYQASLRSNPNNPLAHNNWGLILAQQGRHDEALKHYGQALRIAPRFAPAYVNSAASAEARGDVPAPSSDTPGRSPSTAPSFPPTCTWHGFCSRPGNEKGLRTTRASPSGWTPPTRRPGRSSKT